MTMNPLVEEYKKCYLDKTRQYFIENYLTTFNATERKEVPFKLFPRQIELLKSLTYNNNTIAIKHRQAGITTVTSAWATGNIVFCPPNEPQTILCIGNKLDISEQLLDKIGVFLDQTPRFFWGPEYYSPDKDSKLNTKSIYKARNKQYIELFNGCKVYARSSGPNSARGVSSTTCLIIDECAFLSTPSETYTSSVASTASVSNAKIVLVSTPNGKDELYYKTYHQALNGLNNFHPVEFKWFQDPRYNRFLEWYRENPDTGEKETIKEQVLDKKGNIPYDEERWRKLEKEGWKPTSPWYKEMCKSFNNDSQKIAQELEVSFLGSAGNVLDTSVIEAQRLQNVVQITDDWPLKYPLDKDLWIWEPYIPGHRYIIAADVSSGSSDDATAIEVIDCDAVDENGIPYYGQSAEYSGMKNGEEVAEILFNLGMEYGCGLIVVDCIGGWGELPITYLVNRGYPNLYREDPKLKDFSLGETVNKRKEKREDERLPGFRTNALRSQMLDKFRERLTDNSFRVRSIRVINELDTWVWKNGRPDHMSGFHDDTITCLAMGLFVMEFYMFRKMKDASKDAAMIRSWRSSKSFLTSEDINGAQPKDSLNIAEQKPKHKMPFYSSGAKERQIQKRTMAMLMLGGFKPKNF